MKKKIFARLKPKVASLGFNNKELEGIAATIADNLDSETEATDEDIDAQIDAVLPYLKVGQQYATRLAKPPAPKNDSDEEDEEGTSAKSKSTKTTDDKETPEWAKAVVATVKTLSDEISTLKAEKTTSTRKSQLEAILKDTGKFGERTLKNFAKMKFESDEEFDEFLSDVETDLEDHKQEEGNEDLSTVTKAVGTGDKSKKQKPLSDSEIENIVASIN